MSNTDSDADGNFRRRTRRSVVVKFKFEDSSTSDTDDEPSIAEARSSKCNKKLSSTDDEETSYTDSSASNKRNISLRKRKVKSQIYAESENSSDDSCSPDNSNQSQTSKQMNDDAKESTTVEINNEVDDSSESDSSTDLSEKCPICLYSFRDQEIGTPNNCDHSFCAPCIDEWSKNVQTCPIDRMPFTSIRIRSRYENGTFLREAAVEAKACEPESEFDYTNCEICNSADREESMLLCDGCDKGYHMGCLDPPLTEIPEGSWYCDNCFSSESDISEEDIGQLIEDMEMEVGIPESRLRVRRIEAPRIARTRQSERIMTTIRNRRQGTNETGRRNRETVVDISLPGPSRVTTRTTRTVSRKKPGKPRKPRKRRGRARARKRRSKTYVVEYDVDNFDKKFCIKTTKKVIRRRRKARKTKTGRRCSRRKATATTRSSERPMGSMTTRSANRSIEANYPKLHIFGNKNALEYFSDDSNNENDDDIGLFGSNSSNQEGGVIVMPSSRTVASTRRLLRNKSIAMSTATISEQTATPASNDILSNIMDTMDRWHTISKPNAIEKIKIDKDGTLIVEKDKKENGTGADANLNPNNGPSQSDVVSAPVYPRSGAANGGNNSFTNSNGYRNNGESNNGQTQPINYSFNRDRNVQNQGSFNNINNRNSFGHGNDLNNSFGDNFYPRNLNLNRTPLRQRPQFDNNRFRRSNTFPNRSETRSQGLYDDEDVSTSNAFIQHQSAPLNQSLRSEPVAENLQASTESSANNVEDNAKDQSNVASSEHSSNLGVRPLAPPPVPPMFNLDTQSFDFDGPSTSRKFETQASENTQTQSSDQGSAEGAINMSMSESMPSAWQRTHEKRSLTNYSDSDDGNDDAPGFKYSTESEEVAQKQITADSPLTKEKELENQSSFENDEDLVQLDDDESFANADDENSLSPVSENITQQEEEEKEDENLDQYKTLPPDEKTTESNTSLDEASIVSRTESDDLDMYDSPSTQMNKTKSDYNKSADEMENDQNDKSESDISKSEDSERGERSYTPCLDEKIQANESAEVKEDDQRKEEATNDERRNVRSVIEGIETELISDDESDCLREGVTAKDAKRNKSEKENQQPDRDDSFKKVSRNTKVRNYRDKRDTRRDRKRKRSRSMSRSLSRSLSRPRSRNRRQLKRNRLRRRDNKRQDIERYDVRNIIAERQPIPYKDKYGRDASRQRRSRSRNLSPRRGRSRSRSNSPKFNRRRSLSKRRSLSRRRSISRNRSISPKRSLSRRRSLSRKRSGSRHVSPLRRRHSLSRRNRHHHRKSRSLSRRIGRSPVRRSRSPIRRSRSPLRRTRSPIVFSPSRSPSRNRLINVQNRRSIERSRSLSQRPNIDHDFSISRSRSRSKTKNKVKRRVKDKKLGKAKKRTAISHQLSPAMSPVGRLRSHSNRRSRSKSWGDGVNKIATPWNHSPSPQPGEETWTPPLAKAPENLTVILKNRDAKKKRDKRKKTEKRKTDGQPRKEKRSKRSDKYEKSSAPSKEVFASGDNILVSVSFDNNHKQPAPPPQQTTIVTLPPTKEQILSKKQTDRDGNSKRSRRGNRDPSRKHKKVDIKPVAIIDLDNSPFKEVTPSPRAVIVLTDSEHEDDEINNQNQSNYSNASPLVECENSELDQEIELDPIHTSQPQSPATETETTSFELLLGPKTPPEPQIIKFSLPTNAKSKLRTVINPLHDVNDDDENIDKDENAGGRIINTPSAPNTQSQQIVGPNTPSDFGPFSPDAYDPFEPTKSPSPYPDDTIQSCDDNDLQSISGSNVDESNKPVKPVDVKMAFINSKASLDAANSVLSTTLEGDVIEPETSSTDKVVSPHKEKTLSEEIQSKLSSGIQVFSNILITPGKDTTARNQSQHSQPWSLPLLSLPLPCLSTACNISTIGPAKTALSSSTKQSPMKYGSSTSLISKLPLPKLTKPARHNGNDDNMELESPYSPGSSDYEDLFEPPATSPPSAHPTSSAHLKKQMSQTQNRTTSLTLKQVAGKVDIFDDLFGTSPPGNAGKKAPKRRHKRTSIKEWIAVSKHSTQMGYGKLSEDQLRILEDLPGSAVELQAKDKFLRKLNRQERVVEEVKLVLKPHYTKKHITKEEYKDIMRRSVPKICHNRTGEINPKKIQKLIEAYVRKYRQRKKTGNAT